jgi:nitrite reductase (NADH) small subunit
MRTRVARLADLPDRCGWLVELEEDGREIALFRRGAEVVALDAVCPHRGALLAFGDVRGDLVHCPLHAWGFRLDDGACPEFPGVAVTTYRVTVEGEEVFLEL